MHFLQLAAVAASLAIRQAEAVHGFNTGNINLAGQAKQQSDFEAEFKNQKALVGTDGAFTSARLYTMIQGGSTDSPISAIPAAISTNTGLLLGMWASAGQDAFDAELSALKNAISQYGSQLAPLVQGISVGSEDLYRVTPTGIENKAGIGADADTVISYIKQVRSAIAGTDLAKAPVGHVDTWTVWANSSNANVVENCDFLGTDAYPYYQTQNTNPIQDAGSLFYSALDMTRQNAMGKPVMVTETGWPSSGPLSGEAVASLANARSYWLQVYCTLPSDVDLYWYTQSDADQASGAGTFGVAGPTLSTTPIYNLSCKNTTSASSSASSSGFATKASSASGSKSTGGSGSNQGGSVVSMNSAFSITGTQAVVSATGNAISPNKPYPTAAGNSGVAVGTGGVAQSTGAASPTSTSVSPYPANGASTVSLSLALLAIPAVVALFA